MKVTGVRWFCGTTNVGIVRVLTSFNEINYYIGSVSGDDEVTDTEFIREWGSYFPNDAGDILFGILGE